MDIRDSANDKLRALPQSLLHLVPIVWYVFTVFCMEFLHAVLFRVLLSFVSTLLPIKIMQKNDFIPSIGCTKAATRKGENQCKKVANVQNFLIWEVKGSKQQGCLLSIITFPVYIVQLGKITQNMHIITTLRELKACNLTLHIIMCFLHIRV